ncbi:MAG: porphobilinogen synthase [Methanomassiliicoccales archaeon]
MFPETRLRRLRGRESIRRMVRETSLRVEDLMLPIFVDETLEEPREILSMPGVKAFPPSEASIQAKQAERLGIQSVLLFGVPQHKDEEGSGAWEEQGPVQRAVKSIRSDCQLTVVCDLCLCEYTSHGHCGLVRGGRVDNDATLELYGRIAVSQAKAGAHMVAPSGMMDGQVRAIRHALDEAGFEEVGIMSYSAKYASAFYGPFRDAVASKPSFGDRRTHQMDPGNAREALREMEMDLNEGADILMVKPALPYLDVICRARERFPAPIAAYNVSGEYSMLKLASSQGILEERRGMMEVLTSIKRAGADIIITYHALEAARALKEGDW